MDFKNIKASNWAQIKFVTDILNNENYLIQRSDSQLQEIENKAREMYQILDNEISKQEIYLNLLNDIELTCSEILERRNDEYEEEDDESEDDNF